MNGVYIRQLNESRFTELAENELRKSGLIADKIDSKTAEIVRKAVNLEAVHYQG
jgi:hypothetical protein